jgi:quercetin dioxygenase-like cupin family protein
MADIQQIKLEDLTLDPTRQGPIWAHGGAQLDVNILYFDQGEGVPAHTNTLLDVWLVVLQGAGEAWLDGERLELTPGTCLYIPAGRERAIRATGGPLIYASAHSKRPALMPVYG